MIDLDKISKPIIAIGAIISTYLLIQGSFVTLGMYYEHQRAELLVHIDQYEKLRHHYKDLEDTEGTLSGPDRRRRDLAIDVLDRYYGELELVDKVLAKLN